MPPHHSLIVITERADPSLITQAVLVTNHASWLSKPGRTLLYPGATSPPDGTKDSWTNATSCGRYLRKSSPSWRNFPDTDPGAAPIENWGIRRQYHKRVHLEFGHPASIRCICGPRAPNAASFRGRGIALEPWVGAAVFQSGSGQWLGDICTVRGSGDGSFGDPPRSGKWPGRTMSGSPHTWRTT
jgi:hypothetical protein